jgi:hypothetical protein
MAWTMLDEHRTPRRFRAEAVNTACYVSNRIYLRVYKKKSCYKLMHGRTPKVSHFHVFGCKYFILKKGKKLDKFEARSVDDVFFGYASHSRAYRVFNLETNQIVETCEVTFDETHPRSQLVFECAGDDKLGEEIFQERSMNIEMMKMVVWCSRLSMYLLLRRQSRMGPLPHLRRQTQYKAKLLLRGR